jgi:LmbE family N-acetylglucosaminyl deacetylase
MAHEDSPHAVDITDVFDRKVAALTAHASQTSQMGDQLRTMLADWGHATAVAAGLSADRLAECFKVVPTA